MKTFLKSILFLALVSSCGQPAQEPEQPKPVPSPTPKPGGDKLTFAADVQPLLQTFCSDCHSDDTFIRSEADFRSSKAATRIANGSMPQKQSKNYNQWGDAQRKLIAQFMAQ